MLGLDGLMLLGFVVRYSLGGFGICCWRREGSKDMYVVAVMGDEV